MFCQTTIVAAAGAQQQPHDRNLSCSPQRHQRKTIRTHARYSRSETETRTLCARDQDTRPWFRRCVRRPVRKRQNRAAIHPQRQLSDHNIVGGQSLTCAVLPSCITRSRARSGAHTKPHFRHSPHRATPLAALSNVASSTACLLLKLLDRHTGRSSHANNDLHGDQLEQNPHNSIPPPGTPRNARTRPATPPR
jgi:hypothetical protein